MYTTLSSLLLGKKQKTMVWLLQASTHFLIVKSALIIKQVISFQNILVSKVHDAHFGLEGSSDSVDESPMSIGMEGTTTVLGTWMLNSGLIKSFIDSKGSALHQGCSMLLIFEVLLTYISIISSQVQSTKFFSSVSLTTMSLIA